MLKLHSVSAVTLIPMLSYYDFDPILLPSQTFHHALWKPATSLFWILLHLLILPLNQTHPEDTISLGACSVTSFSSFNPSTMIPGGELSLLSHLIRPQRQLLWSPHPQIMSHIEQHSLMIFIPGSLSWLLRGTTSTITCGHLIAQRILWTPLSISDPSTSSNDSSSSTHITMTITYMSSPVTAPHLKVKHASLGPLPPIP